jgi:hypothetical protein
VKKFSKSLKSNVSVKKNMKTVGVNWPEDLGRSYCMVQGVYITALKPRPPCKHGTYGTICQGNNPKDKNVIL